MAAAATTTKTSTTDNQQDSIVDKSKEETIKTELPISQSYMTTKQNNESNKIHSNIVVCCFRSSCSSLVEKAKS